VCGAVDVRDFAGDYQRLSIFPRMKNDLAWRVLGATKCVPESSKEKLYRVFIEKVTTVTFAPRSSIFSSRGCLYRRQCQNIAWPDADGLVSALYVAEEQCDESGAIGDEAHSVVADPCGKDVANNTRQPACLLITRRSCSRISGTPTPPIHCHTAR